ncbi:MAG: sigma-70 family RNA polymerase sigma factor [Proteobacteria bacterium]|nr:sigma-70 family RNA polymerase sigma factor [Pseudomonadota bacterium]
MRAAQDGDKAAYRELLREILPLLRRVLRARLRFLQPADIEDLVQDTLLSVHAVRATYDPARPFLPWLMAIARNRVADNARRFGRRVVNEAALKSWMVTFSAAETNMISESYGDPEAMHAAIQGLPRGQREAVELVKLREMSLRQASEVSGMSVAALKVSVHRAMKTLRGVMVKGK